MWIQRYVIGNGVCSRDKDRLDFPNVKSKGHEVCSRDRVGWISLIIWNGMCFER